MALLRSGVRARILLPFRGWVAGWLIIQALFSPLAIQAAERAGTASEYQVKAVFIYNCAQFVEWPPAALPSAQDPFVIGILGDDPFGPFLDETIRGENIHQRPLVIQHYRSVEEIGACHVLYISRSESGRLEQTLARLKGRSILTVSDVEGFALRGGMVRLILERGRVRLRINLDASQAAGLEISSKLLRLAEIVSTTQRTP